MSLTAAQAPAREYATRPRDERFASVQALIDHSRNEKNLSKEVSYNLKDLRAVVARPDGSAAPFNIVDAQIPDEQLMLQSPRGRGVFSHWSFGQLARTIGAPAGYLRTLPPSVAADCLNYGLSSSPTGTTANLLVRAPNGRPEPLIRACTSDTYGRAWDADLLDLANKFVFQSQSRNGHDWKNAPTWAGEEIAGFRGDRDSFVIQIDGGSIVNDPSAADGNGQMYRAVMMRNSEVGAAGVTLEVALIRFICGNWLLWGASVGHEYRRRHVGSNVIRDVVKELGNLAYKFTNRSAAQDEQLIRALIDREIAHTREAVIDELRAMKMSKEDAESAYDRCERTENASPRSFWGICQGVTRLSQDQEHTNSRYVLDQIAGAILAKGAKLVRV